MRWETAASTSNNEVYHLYKEDKKILTVILNPFSNAARVECEKQKRVFLIRTAPNNQGRTPAQCSPTFAFATAPVGL